MNDPSFFWLFGLFILPFAWTPGPVNVTLAAAGATRGFWASLPLILGINTAFFLQAMGVGLGLETLFALYPLSYTILRFVGAAYILYLAYKMTRLTLHDTQIDFTFWHGFLLSMLNPKVYMTLIAMYAQFAAVGKTFWGVLLLSTMSLLAFFIGNSLWCYMGSALRRYLERSPRFFRFYRIGIGLILVAMAVLLIAG